VKRAFFFHFNKPASLQRGKPTISVHYGGNCYLVDNVDVRVATRGRVNPNRSPKFVMGGKAATITIEDGLAVIQ
jgi:hypothetical protein